MILFLYGDDSFRSKQKLDAIKAKYIDASLGDTNLSVLDFEDKSITYEKITREILAFPFLAPKRLVVFVDFMEYANKDLQEKILKFMDSVPETTVLIFYERSVPDRRSVLFKKLAKPKLSEEYKPLEGNQLRKWIEGEIQNQGASIEPSAIDKLIEYVGNDLWQMSNEISKLVSYSHSEVTFSSGTRSHPTRPDNNRGSTATRSGDIPRSKAINMEDVEILVKPKIEGNVFELVDALGQKNEKKATKSLQELLDTGENEIYIFTMVVYQFRNLLIIKDYVENFKSQAPNFKQIPNNNFQISKQLGLSPFVVQKTIQQAKNYEFTELRKIYQKLFDYDLKMKTGKIDQKLALDVLVGELCVV